MIINRYSPYFNYELDKFAMDEDPNGEYYSRAQLIAAGVLVPVPHGTSVQIVNLELPYFGVEPGGIDTFRRGSYSFKTLEYRVADIRNPSSARRKVFKTDRVEPRRLVRLEDLP